MSEHSNHLIHETSPYLLQHAHNPVNWYPWGNEALNRAKEENKPILVSIGYAACHWCHVMERESFEDEATAAIMNENFINIKIDREERPDLDHIYMDAVQAMTGSGGWPLNVFLTPDAKPFYGGTYFPPKKAFNRPSWQETLFGVVQAFKEKRHEIDAQAENLTDHLLKSNSFGLQKMKEEEVLSPDQTSLIYENIMKSADKIWGGFGTAPKFPQTFSIQYLLRNFYLTKNDRSLAQALLTLEKMLDGGIYDQVGGGFARYSTDTEWFVPHFEKMLYDNALLISVLCEAYQLTRYDRYRDIIEETMEFVKREMTDPGGGFYSALDADSEGVEGKFYIWSFEEIEKILGEQASIFAAYFDITKEGNWEGTNILRTKGQLALFASENKIDVFTLKKLITEGKAKLLAQREKRVRPLLDDKIILGWNALMNTACSKAFSATGKEEYRQLAIGNMQFLLSAFAHKTGRGYYHTWKNDQAKYPAFLDDHAFLIRALIDLQEVTGERSWLIKAKAITENVIDNFSEEGTGFFYYTPADQVDVILRKKEVYDGAVPSGNSVMAYNLYHLSILFDLPEWKTRSSDMILSLGKAIITYPTSFGNWAALLQEIISGTNEITLTGAGLPPIHTALLGEYIPHRVLMASATIDENFPLLTGKIVSERPVLQLCRNYTCLVPVFSVKELTSLIDSAPGG